jgi:hypothetical protein
MKMTPELQQVQEKMMPGKITGSGFLGDDPRPLVDIIQADEETAAGINLDWEEAIKKLESFLEQGKQGFGESVTVDKIWNVTVNEARGFHPCPYGDGLHRKHVITVAHVSEDIKFTFSELSLHLLKAHHFLQGKGSPFRLEPGLLKQICER